MADILQELIGAVSDGLAGPPEPGEPHAMWQPEPAAGDMHAVWEPEAG